MRLENSILHSQGLSSKAYSELIQFHKLTFISFRIISKIAFLCTHSVPRSLFPIGFPVRVLKKLLPSPITAIFLAFLGEVLHCKTIFTLHSHPLLAQIFAMGSCSQVPSARTPPLM